MTLTADKIQAIRQIIQDQHWAFVANTMGPGAVPKEIMERLKTKGLVDVENDWVEASFQFGQVVAATRDPKMKDMSLDAFREYLRNNPPPLTMHEQSAIMMARVRAAEHITNMGDRMRSNVVQEVIQNVETRGTSQDLKTALGNMAGDWKRNWNRVAVTEKHDVMQSGLAMHISSTSGTDARVAIRAMPDACKHCKRLHNGPDGVPRIFKLVDLEANGSNVGRKAADWLPGVGPVHPHCQCQLFEIPEGWGFEEDSSLSPTGELGVNYAGPEDVRKSLDAEEALIKAWKLQDHIEYQGIPIAIENQAGTYRHWKGEDGEDGKTLMQYAYGYVKRSLGADGDEIDVFIGPDPVAPAAYVIHQQDPKTGLYDEDKVMLGFSSEDHAEKVYRDHYNRPDFFVTISTMGMGVFKDWCAHTRPAKGEMAKAIPLVIPFEKALVTQQVVSEHHDDRSPAVGAGSGMNQVFHHPRNEPTKPDPDVKRDLREFVYQGKRPPLPRHRDMEGDYAMNHAVDGPVQTLALDQLTAYVVDYDAEYRQRVEKKHQDHRPVDKNETLEE